jgi:hypothetical protein
MVCLTTASVASLSTTMPRRSGPSVTKPGSSLDPSPRPNGRASTGNAYTREATCTCTYPRNRPKGCPVTRMTCLLNTQAKHPNRSRKVRANRLPQPWQRPQRPQAEDRPIIGSLRGSRRPRGASERTPRGPPGGARSRAPTEGIAARRLHCHVPVCPVARAPFQRTFRLVSPARFPPRGPPSPRSRSPLQESELE